MSYNMQNFRRIREEYKENLDSAIEFLKGGSGAVLRELNGKMEAAAETLLASKGFSEAVVSISDEMVDVVVNKAELDDASLAQIEDIVARKTQIAPENIVITPIN